jgi:hypothetical protein
VQVDVGLTQNGDFGVRDMSFYEIHDEEAVVDFGDIESVGVGVA